MGTSMKVHQFARGLIWEHEPSLSLDACKRLRPLAPKLAAAATVAGDSALGPFDLKSFIRPRKQGSSSDDKRESLSSSSSSTPRHRIHHQVVETQPPGGTRWNPTQEQIGILEALYRRGMRTPNAQQIEQITSELGKYGKIEGKNVFYWFQNHKARERQKQKRNSLGLSHCPRTATPQLPTLMTTTNSNSSTTVTLDVRGEVLLMENKEQDSPYKRKLRGWTFECLEDEKEGDRTLELFPLHPEGR